MIEFPMHIPLDQLPFIAYAHALVFGLLTLAFYVRTLSLKKKLGVMISDMEKNPIELTIKELEKEKANLDDQLQKGNAIYAKLLEAYTNAETQVGQINVGLPPPNFKIDDDEDLKTAVRDCRAKQLELIKSQRATISLSNWKWFGSEEDEAKLIEIYNKLMIGAFNAEFDMIREKMRHSSYDTALSKLRSSTSALEKLADTVNVTIATDYLSAKEEELSIWHSDLVRRQEEKAERKRQKAILREQNQSLGRISDDDESNDDEELECQLEACAAELAQARKLAEAIAGDELAKLELKIEHIIQEKQALEEKFVRAVSQAQITRAGYIYVISNIGSFGEGVCKIGMTRRLEPMDRVVELGDASVPYRFDVHTLAFVEDAPKVEKALHTVFEAKRVNKENLRKEFFFVSPKEVKAIMDEIGIKSSWYYDCDAKEFRESELIRESMLGERTKSQSTSSELPEAI